MPAVTYNVRTTLSTTITTAIGVEVTNQHSDVNDSEARLLQQTAQVNSLQIVL